MQIVTRRSLLVGSASAVGALLLLQRAAFGGFEGAPTFDGVPQGDAPGDKGYKHAMYHDFYQEVFGKSGRCLCNDGECRVTDWRETELGSPKGYDVIVGRKWWPLLENVYIPPPQLVPAQLRHERAHVCAYDLDGLVIISCAIINSSQA